MKVPKGKKAYIGGKVFKAGSEIPDKDAPKGLDKPGKPDKPKPADNKNK